MSLPAVTISKPVFSSASSPNVTTGILAIIAASSTGTFNQPLGVARSDVASTTFGTGPLPEYCAYNIAVANTPTVLVRSNPTYPGAYQTGTGALNTSGVTGTSVVTTSGTPFDHYAVQVTIIAGGTVGSAGITYQWSVDGGATVSGTTATVAPYNSISLVSAGALTPTTGVTFNLGAGTLVSGDTWSVFTERPLMNDADVTTSLAALFTTRMPFEGVYVDSSASTTTVNLIDTFLAGQEALGIFKFVILNSPYKFEPEPTAETEGNYTTRMSNLFTTAGNTIRGCVGADGAHVPSVITGFNIKRPTGMLTASRAMAIPIGTDPAYVALGNITGASIVSSQGNPFDHDEGLFPTLDPLRFVTLRSFPAAGPSGVYITNANVMQPNGGSYPYLQHIRIMNTACSIAWQVLTTNLSRGVRKNPKADPVTGAVYIFEPDAANIESQVNTALAGPLAGQVSAVNFSLSRTDNMNAIPCVVTGVLSIQALAYIKGFTITAEFSKTIQTAV